GLRKGLPFLVWALLRLLGSMLMAPAATGAATVHPHHQHKQQPEHDPSGIRLKKLHRFNLQLLYWMGP
ncbi:MAG: hypothetical protein ACYC5J_06425, partial [Chloroflexota bacterium]